MTKTTKILITIGIAVAGVVFISMPVWAIQKDKTSSIYLAISFPASLVCAFVIKAVWGYKSKGNDKPGK